ncbi:uncharacterized protein LOC130217424 [Danio aesculapii]|uniref:uncharacterized protein LOC130217424 n=1 Tax=Danio aesculapii TaxID=1142201 RepID=UPI0024BF27D9|nr:uncharacterized protein LOC130217424 [Danio aesculapii]
MLTCFLCTSSFGSPLLLFRHLKLIHGMYPGKNLRLKCGQAGCCLQFSSYSGFRRHLIKIHSSVGDRFDFYHTPSSHDSEEQNSQSLNDTMASTSSQCQSVEAVPSTHKKDMCASIIAKLLASGVPNTVVLSTIENLEEFVEDLHSDIKDHVLNLLPSNNTSRPAIEELFESLDNPFSELNSDTKWKKYFREKWGVVDPVELHLGVRYDTRRNNKTGNYEQVPVNNKFIYIPILKTLQFIFRNEKNCEMMQTCTQSDIYEDFCDGSYFKNHPLFSTNKFALQIQLYFEFECANPLGSKKGIHKIGCLYFILRNLAPKVNSALMNIHLVSLFHAQDVKKYGIDEILKPLIRDLKILETVGVAVPFADQPVRGTLALITGDNLGMHSILGFLESFSANYFCRFCLIDKSSAQFVFSEDDPNLTLLSPVLNDQHFASLEDDPTLTSSFGIKRKSILNTLQYFNTGENYAVDIMHDILEGVGQYEIKLLFEYLIQHFISKESLLNRIYAFNYGYMETKNKPTIINLDCGGHGIGLNASQTLCLITNIPLIFGDLVPEDDLHWHLLLLLLNIINIVFSYSITEGMTVYLKHLIIEHHKLFKELYPSNNLLPKHHFMVHYPRCIRKVGPLIHIWTMRFEAKHKFFKDSVKNFKNLTISLANKHQFAVAYHWECLSLKTVESGPVKISSLDTLEFSEDVSSTLQVDSQATVNLTKWVRCCGVEYRVGLFVCTGTNENVPLFSKITSIILHNGKVFFVLIEHETCFHDHFHAFQVSENLPRKVLVVESERLRHFKSFDSQMSYGCDSQFYVLSESCII